MKRITHAPRPQTDRADGAQWLLQLEQARIALRHKFEAMQELLACEQSTNSLGPTPRPA